MKTDTYYNHQTPRELAKQLITYIPIVDGDVCLEPFKGEGAFYDNLPNNCVKQWCEIEEGKCYTSFTGKIDWVISNPPFRLDTGTKRVNAFWEILNYYADRVEKGICFLANYQCFNTLTPKRMTSLNEKGLYISKIIVCNVKKWSNRYYFIIFTKQKNEVFNYLTGSY